MALCKGCGLPFEAEQGKRFNTDTGDVYHDHCWPFICCAECGGVGECRCEVA